MATKKKSAGSKSSSKKLPKKNMGGGRDTGGHVKATTDRKCPKGYVYVLSQGNCMPKGK